MVLVFKVTKLAKRNGRDSCKAVRRKLLTNRYRDGRTNRTSLHFLTEVIKEYYLQFIPKWNDIPFTIRAISSIAWCFLQFGFLGIAGSVFASERLQEVTVWLPPSHKASQNKGQAVATKRLECHTCHTCRILTLNSSKSSGHAGTNITIDDL